MAIVSYSISYFANRSRARASSSCCVGFSVTNYPAPSDPLYPVQHSHERLVIVRMPGSLCELAYREVGLLLGAHRSQKGIPRTFTTARRRQGRAVPLRT